MKEIAETVAKRTITQGIGTKEMIETQETSLKRGMNSMELGETIGFKVETHQVI